MTTAFKNRGWL